MAAGETLVDGKPLTAAYHYGLTVLNLFGIKNAKGGLDDAAEMLAPVFKKPQVVSRTADDIAAFLRTKCFARDTLVLTDLGYREIGNIRPGEQVLSYDFRQGEWTYRTVTERIDNTYEGAVVTVETDDCRIEATIHHPFWVVKGHELDHRNTPRELAVDEDQNLSLEGRWVDSHELLAGDTIVGKDGKLLVVRGISQRLEAEFPVANLTIAGLHNYTVGTPSILVHNTAICDAGQAALRDILNSGAATLDDIARSVRGFTNADEVLRSLASLPVQNHHLISNPIRRALNRAGLDGNALRKRPELQYLSAPGQHIGYPDWHRQLDRELVDFITGTQGLTEKGFLQHLHNVYQRPDLAFRIRGSTWDFRNQL